MNVIPTIEDILKALFSGDMDVATASRYIARHIEMAEERGARPAESVAEDGLVAAFPNIALGYGLVEIGDATWEGLPALWFGKNGADVGPIGSKRVRDNMAEDGETLALITFANLKGLEQVEDALGRVRLTMATQADNRKVGMDAGAQQ